MLSGLGGVGFDEVLRLAIELSARLTRRGVPHAVIGGIAVAAHGYKRNTVDVDLLVPSDRVDIVKHGFRGPAYLLTMRGLVGRTYKMRGVSVDVIAPSTAPGADLLDEAARSPIADVNYGIQVVGIEALVLLKLLAGRHRDRGDLIELLALGATTPEKVERLLDRLGSPDLVETFERVLREAEEDRDR